MMTLIAKFFAGKSFLVLLTAAVVGLGVLLVSSYKTNGVLSSEVTAWKQLTDDYADHIKKLNQMVIERERRLKKLATNTNKSIKQIIEVKDETNCIDRAMPDDLRVQFQGSGQNVPESPAIVN